MNDTTTPPRAQGARHDPTNYSEDLGHLYRQHHQTLLRKANRWAPPHAARDIIQTVLRDLLARPREIKHFVRYVSGALRKAAKDLRLKEKKQRRIEAELSIVPLEGLFREVPSAEACASMTEQLQLQLSILGPKGAQALQAFELVRIKGLTAEQAGRHMSLSRDQVSRLIARVLLALQSAYEQGGSR